MSVKYLKKSNYSCTTPEEERTYFLPKRSEIFTIRHNLISQKTLFFITMIPKAEDIIKNFNSLESILMEIMSGNKPHYGENIFTL